MALNPGSRLGPYEILAPLGAGGMGEVYRARDSRLEREVAIKVLPEQTAKNGEALSRFEREAKAVAALNHPNILAIHDFGDHDGIAYAVMELLEGETLRGRLTRSALSWQKAVEIAIAVAEGLAAAHDKGIIHRDLKPDNLFMTSDGRLKILDFYKGQDVDAKKVGRQLKVRALLTGRVQQRGETLSIQAELVDVTRESQLWGERFQRKAEDIFAVEEEIATQISEKLRLKLSGQGRARLLKRYTENTEAYHLYLKGRFYWNKRTGEALRKAIEYFQQAVDKDPEYALAYAGLADGYLVLSFFAPDPKRAFLARAKVAALKALELDDALGEAYTALGVILGCLDWDWAGAERSLPRAIELKPDCWLAHDHYGMVLSSMGRHEEAVREVRRGLELEPLSLVASHHFGWVHIRARRYQAAIDQCRKAVEMDPNFAMGHFWLGLACGLVFRYDEAIPALQAARRGAGTSFTALELARVYALSGRTAEAQGILQEMHQTFEQDYAEPMGFATVYAALGQADEAFRWLDRGMQDRSGFVAMWACGDPRLDALRGDPRMGDVMRRLGVG